MNDKTKKKTTDLEVVQGMFQSFKSSHIGIQNTSEAVYYTQQEADAHNAELTGALDSTTPLTAEQAAAYNAAVTGATKEAGDTLSAEEAAAYNATLDGAVTTEDVKTPAVPKKVKDYVDEKDSQKADKVSGSGLNNHLAALNSNGNLKDSGIPVDNVVEKDGEYMDLVAGNIVGEFSDEAEVSFRPTAGAVNIESGKADKGAKITGIKGNTRAWNQLVENGDFSNGTTGWACGDTTLSASGNILTITTGNDTPDYVAAYSTFNYTVGHVYYCSVYVNSPSPSNNNSFGLFGSNITVSFNANEWKKLSGLSRVNETPSVYRFQLLTSIGAIVPAGGHIQFKNAQCIDLTLIYGYGNEPETAAEFEADYQRWFGKPLTYEAYDAGSLRPVKMTGLKTTGFNAWDEEWELGMLYPIGDNFGKEQVSEIQIRNKGYIPALPETKYYLKCGTQCGGVFVFSYDSNKSAIASWRYKNAVNTTFTTPANAKYIRFYCTYDYGTTYNHDICINLSYDGDRDGDYEEHWESEVGIDITKLTGKLNGTGNSVTVFPDGLKKAGTVYDEIVRRGDKTYGIKRIGAVDMGTRAWNYNSGQFLNTDIDCKQPDNSSLAINIVTPIYETSKYNENRDKTIHGTWASASSKYIGIFDSAYSNAATFKTAMSGVMLYYELETPEEYLLDDFELPQEYDVDDYGTEEVQLGTGGIAPVLDIKYGINAPDTIKNLPHSYVSAVGEQNFTDAQQARARKNIGAASQHDMDVVKKQLELIDKKVDNDYYVDMGLPSGLLWAKRNIDVTQPDGFAASPFQYECSFFSWGNTEGHNPADVSSFSYNWGGINESDPPYEGQVYGSTPGNALTGNIAPSQDAARVNLGAPWRMPTTEEYAELFANIDYIDGNGNVIDSAQANKLVTIEGITGIRIKSKVNGNTLFFPCSGNGAGTSLYGRGERGFCWSASFSSARIARSLYFSSGGVSRQYVSNRYVGFAVRPVM